MNDVPPMSLESKLLRRKGTEEYPHAVTQAERFVDDVTHLRMLRLRHPLVNPDLSGSDNETIKAVHLGADKARLERWQHPEDTRAIVDVAYRFADGSLAYRIAATGRWEVWRTW